MQLYPFLDELTYCLESGFPAPLTETMLAIAADQDSISKLRVAYLVWLAWGELDDDEFIDAVQEVTGDCCSFCDDCHALVWEFDNSSLNVCDDCLGNYTSCDSCESLTRDTTYVDGLSYCESCLGTYCTFCNRCDAYIRDCDEEHGHACECVAPHLRFEFPNDGHGTVSQDEQVTVELPKGTIDEEGIRLITNLVQQAVSDAASLAQPNVPLSVHNNDFFFVYEDMEEVGTLWQTKQGNFTRRLSSALYKKHKFKLPAGVISEVGNLARAHSSNTAEWIIDFTRDLNLPAEDFYHEDSCWFTEGSYGASRCALKQWGGLGLRTYNDRWLTGRAWVQPLNKDLKPTHDTINAHAYVVYNGYGELEGYTAARIVAHLTSRTYRKIELRAAPQFVNGEGGYLVADEATCLKTGCVSYCYAEHHTTDADEIKVEVYA